MTVSLTDFLSHLISSPPLIITTLLTLGVIMVNGWTMLLTRLPLVFPHGHKSRAAIVMAAFLTFLVFLL